MNNFTNYFKKLSLFLMVAIGFCYDAQAQELLLNPTSTVYELNPDIPEYVCPYFDTLQLLREDSIRDSEGISPARFAKAFDFNFSTSNSGTWESVGDVHIWRYKITSYNAYSMMTVLEDINIPENAGIFIYNEDMTHVVGPITSSVNQYGVYASELIRGASIIIELIIQGEYRIDNPYFTITEAAHDYYDFYGYVFYNDKSKFAKRIDDCINKDINCPIGADWQTHKRSVALMVSRFKVRRDIGDEVERDMGYCTGATINNTNFDGKSLFLTANHCFDNLSRPQNTVFYFNHESKECGSKKDNALSYTVSGATIKSSNGYSDFALLELHSRVPSSYQPYFAGWDKSGESPANGVGIHHPAGNLKKIAKEIDPIFPNTTTSYYPELQYTFAVNSLWRLNFDEGGIIGGSSGSPLFNQNKKIVGQLLGGVIGCSTQKDYGRLSVSWNHGSTPSTRLKEWLDPTNQNPDEILGYVPAGWRNVYLTNWNPAPIAANKIYPGVKSIAVGEGNQVFYRGEDNKMQVYYFNTNTNNWVHDWVRGWNIPNYELIAGDVVVGSGNQLFYRGTDGKIHTYYWSGGTWHHNWLTGPNSPSNENVSAVPGSIAVGNGNQVFYRGTDNKMHVYYWTPSGWQHVWIVSGAPSWQNVAGDIVVGTDNNQNQVYYRGTDGKMQVYYFDFSSNQWLHGWIANNWGPSSENVSSIPGSVTVSSNNQIFYRGTDDLVHVHYFGSGSWHHGWMVNGAGNDQKISGGISAGENGQIFYRGFDGKMHVYWYNSSTSQWVHDWLENSWQAPFAHNIAGSIDVGEQNQVFYRGTDGLCRVYYFDGGYMQRPSENYNYGMEGVKTQPLIPIYEAKFDLTVYPNPVQDLINVVITNNDDNKFEIILADFTGRVLLKEEKTINKGINKIDIQLNESIGQGVYLLKARNLSTNEQKVVKVSKL